MMETESVEQQIARLEIESMTLLSRLDQAEKRQEILTLRCERAEAWVGRMVVILEGMRAKAG